MAVKGVRGVVVAGRVRELARLRAVVNGKADVGPEPAEWRAGVPIMEPTQPGNNSSGRKEGMPIWSRGTSVVGMKAEAKPWAVNVPVRIGQVEVFPGDVVMLDHAERGAVCVPAMLVDKVLDMLPRVAEGETKMLQHVEAGGTVSDAGRMYRGK